MSNRTLARADDAVWDVLEDGQMHRVGMWEEVTIERSAAGAPGLLFTITRYDGDLEHDRMTVNVPDGVDFLAPVARWLNGNDPEPYIDQHGSQRSPDGDPAGFDFDTQFYFNPRPGYNQNPEDYA